MKKKLTKRLRAAVTITLAVLMVVTTTFGWQSISQASTNQANGTVNVGARLHDDFDGTNKRIYVENFTNQDSGGQPVYARVKLTQYMEIGGDAGTTAGEKKAQPVVEGTSLSDKSIWPAYFKSSDKDKNEKLTGENGYWDWALGGTTVYMPTFNKNKDSILADVNGSWEGSDGLTPYNVKDDGKKYNDNVTYKVGDTRSKYAVYDNDSNDGDEISRSTLDSLINAKESEIKELANASLTNIKVSGYDKTRSKDDQSYTREKHTAVQTPNAEVISMTQWKEQYDSEPGYYWVYDETDGWAYWAMPIQPGEATGCLLSNIGECKDTSLKNNWYYSIDVNAQFITEGDIGNVDTLWPDTVKDKDSGKYLGPSEDAKALLVKAVAAQIK